jgi:hypothetical protein
MLPAKQDLTLDTFPEPRTITLHVEGITPGGLTLLDALDIAEASGVDPDDMMQVLAGKQTRKQGMLMYAIAWVLGRRVEPGLTFEEVLTCHLHVVGKAAPEAQIEAEQKRSLQVASVAMLAGVSLPEAEQMSIADVAAVTSIHKARRRPRRR